MNRSRKKTLITIRERAILHVLAFQRFYQDADAPPAVTQEGIAEAIGVGRNNVSKIVNGLIEDGTLEVQSKHVKGYPSVRKVYYLGESGFAEALRLKTEIETTKVTLVDFEGKEIEEEIGKISIHLPKKYPLLDVVLGVAHGRFDCSAFHEQKIKDERRFVDYTDRKPAVRNFYGRSQEMKKVKTFLDSETARLLSVYGIPGIGKTTLLAKLTQDIRETNNVFWYRIHEWVTLKIILSPLAEFISQLGKKGLERYLGRTETPNVGEVCSILEEELKEVNALLILDDIQKADPEVNSLLSALVGILDNLPGIKVICASREIPSFYNRSVVVKGTVEELMLEGLDRDSSVQLMRMRNLPDSHYEAIYRATNGHPLFLELIDDPRSALGKNIRMFIEQEVHSKLDYSEKRILEISCIFRYPILVDAFFTIEEETAKELGKQGKEMAYQDFIIDYDTIDGLLAKSLLHESMNRMIGMHDLLRDFFYARLTPRQRTLYHKAASQYYLQDNSAPSHVEALYHSLMAKEYATAIRIAARSGRDIISKGYGIQFAPLLRSLLAQCDQIQKSEKMEVLMLEGEIEDIQGDWDKALSSFNQVMALASPEIDKRILAEVSRRIGVIHLRQAKFREAEVFLDQSLNIAEEINNTHTLVEILYDLGGVFERMGRTQEAMAAFSKSRDLAQSVGDDSGLGKALYGLGRVYMALMDFNSSIKIEKEALEVIERTGDVNEIATVSIGLGASLLEAKRFEDAIEYLDKAIDMARSSGNQNLLAWAMTNAATCYFENGNLRQAEELVSAASTIFERLNDQVMVANVHFIRGFFYNRRKEWEWAKEEFRTGFEKLRRLNVPFTLGRWLFEVGQECVKNEDYDEAKTLLHEALEIAESSGHEELRREVKEAMDSMSV